MSDSPYLIQPVDPRPVQIFEGANFTLACKAIGYPVAEESWYRIDEFGDAVNLTRGIAGNGKLVFEKAEKRDSGMYGCSYRNALGSVGKKQDFIVCRDEIRNLEKHTRTDRLLAWRGRTNQTS